MIIYSGVVIGLPPFSQCNRPRCSKILAACCCPPRWGRPKIRLFIFTFHIQPTSSSTKANTSTDKIRIHIQADGQSASQADSHAVRRTDRQPARHTCWIMLAYSASYCINLYMMISHMFIQSNMRCAIQFHSPVPRGTQMFD